MNKPKGLKYYAWILAVSFLGLVAYVSYLALRNDGYDWALVTQLLYVPPLFTGLLFVFDKVFDKFFPKPKVSDDKQYEAFSQKINQIIQDQTEFEIEDFYRLQENDRFQKAVRQAFQISIDGENNDVNFTMLEKKFKKQTNEYIALELVIKEVKKMMGNS